MADDVTLRIGGQSQGAVDAIEKTKGAVGGLEKASAATAASLRTMGADANVATGFVGRMKEGFTQFLATLAGMVSAQSLIGMVKSACESLVGELKKITIEGAKVAEVEEAFKRLTSQVGLSASTLMGTLRNATHNTITDFDLMKRVNQDLAAGLNLSEKDFRLLAEGAFALAKATGGDVKSALDTMSDAMLTGRTRGIALMTGKIDLTAAETKLAASLGTTKDGLSDEGKLEAARVGILDTVRAALGRLGTQTENLDDQIAQAQVAWQNFQADLGKTVAQSPVIQAAIIAIKDGLVESFGPSREQQIKGIARAIDDVLISLVGMASTAGTAAGFVGIEFNAAKVVFYDLRQAMDFVALGFNVLAASAAIAKAATIGGALTLAADLERIKANMAALVKGIDERGAAIVKAKQGEEEWAKTGERLSAFLADVKAKMEAARQGVVTHTAATEDHTSATRRNTAALFQQTDAEKEAQKATDNLAAVKKELTGQEQFLITTLMAEGASLSDVAKSYHINEAAAKAYADTTKEVLDGRKALREFELDSAVRVAEANKVASEKIITLERAKLAAIQEVLPLQIAAYKDYDEKRYQLTLKGVNLVLRQQEVEKAGVIATLQQQFGEQSDLYWIALAQIEAYYAALAKRTKEAAADWKGALSEMSAALSQLAQIAPGSLGTVLQGFATVVASANAAVKSIQAVAAAGKTMATAVGGAVMVAAGAVAVFVGAFLLANKIISGHDDYSRWVTQQREASAKLRADIAETYGGLANLVAAADAVGIDWHEVFNWDDPAAIQSVIDDLTARTKILDDTLAKYGLTWKDTGEQVRAARFDLIVNGILDEFGRLSASGVPFETAVTGMSGSLSQLIIDAIDTGQQIPPALQPMLEQMIRAGELTDAAARAMLGLAADTMPSLKDVTEAADRYGLKLDDLGPKVQQLRITESATQIAKDFEMLTRAGVPFETLMTDVPKQVTDSAGHVTTVMTGMHSQVQTLVNNAMKYGAELPESMRPMLQAMADAGTLTDENGTKLTDLGKIKFATDLTTMFETLIGKLDTMFARLGTDIPGAGKQGAKDTQEAWDKVDLRTKAPWDDWGTMPGAPEVPPGTRPGRGGIRGAAGGVFATRPLLRVFGEGGEPELGGPVSFMQSALEGALRNLGEAYASVSNGARLGPMVGGLLAGGGSGGPPTVNVSVVVDASGAWIHDRDAVDQLAQEIGQSITDRYFRYVQVPA